MTRLVLMLAAGAVAATSTVSLTVTPSVVKRGQPVHIRGVAGDCPIGDAAIIISHAFPGTHEFAGVPSVLGRVGAGGRFQATTRIPAGRRAGTYLVTARCGGGNLGVSVRLTVRR